MEKQEEIKIINRLTKTTDEQIKINEIGWTSRVYLVDGGRFVFKFPRSKQAREELRHEINVLELIKNYEFSLKTQVVKLKVNSNEYAGFIGVPGEALTPKIMKRLDSEQKKNLGRQLGTFLKKLHGIKGFENPAGAEQDQIEEYQEKYRENRKAFNQHFDSSEMAFIDELFLTAAPKRIEELGKDLVFCHGDFGYNNI